MRTEFFHVDSKHREGGTYGTAPNFYKWKFPHTIKGVHRVEVLHAEIPNSQYNVPVGNTFTFEYRTVAIATYTTVTISLPPGNYTRETLETALNDITALYGIDTIINPNDGRILLWAGGSVYSPPILDPAFGVKFIPGACSRCFGISPTWWAFPPPDYTQAKSYNVVQLYATHAFFLRVPELGQTHNNIHTSGAMYSSNRPGVIGRFQNVAAPFDVNHYRDDLQVYYKSTNPSFLLNLTEITIEWLDTDGYGVDFNGADHSFFLKVTYEDQ